MPKNWLMVGINEKVHKRFFMLAQQVNFVFVQLKERWKDREIQAEKVLQGVRLQSRHRPENWYWPAPCRQVSE